MNFAVIEPTISNVVPNTGTVGAAVTIMGANFGDAYNPATMSVLLTVLRRRRRAGATPSSSRRFPPQRAVRSS